MDNRTRLAIDDAFVVALLKRFQTELADLQLAATQQCDHVCDGGELCKRNMTALAAGVARSREVASIFVATLDASITTLLFGVAVGFGPDMTKHLTETMLSEGADIQRWHRKLVEETARTEAAASPGGSA